MKIRIWGCRGSLPTPGSGTLRYGGNTTCLEIIANNGRRLIIDAGSGLRPLGKELVKMPGEQHLCLIMTHCHWDHLMGFPFFVPGYLERFSINVCGGPNAQSFLKDYLSQQMQAPYFPVGFEVLKARFRFECGQPGGRSCCPITIEPIPLSHPNGGYGFMFLESGRRFVFLTDNELGLVHPGGLDRDRYVEICREADLLIHDAQYTDDEYRKTRGWGHSTFREAVDLALDAQVKKLCLFHHDPDRNDDELDVIVANCRRYVADMGSSLEVVGVHEGDEYDLPPGADDGESPPCCPGCG